MSFDRTNGAEDLLKSLSSEELYLKYLKEDKNVFMALRKKEIHFYYCGSKLFGYTKKGFESHKKFCFNADLKNDYILINDIKSTNPIIDIKKNYKLIKENAKNYAGIEALGVSNLLKYDFNTSNRYIVLDTEIALYDKDTKDRIDLLLYDKEKRKLKFVEAKHFTNSELWSKGNTKPKVTKQIERYNSKLASHGNEILEEYKKYINILNNFSKANLDKPIQLEKTVSLYMFGFDNNQKQRIKELLEDDNSLDGIDYYFKGNEKDIDIKRFFK